MAFLPLIPDLIPVLGYADDAIIATAVLRSVVRRAGLDAVRKQWPGTDDGFAAVVRLTGLGHQGPQGRGWRTYLRGHYLLGVAERPRSDGESR